MNGRVSLLTVGLVAGLARVAAAGTEPPAAVVGESIDVRVVNVEAQVVDRRGQPVHGLAAGDFLLFVDGREVPIGYFTEVRDGQAASTGAAVAAPARAPSGASGPPASQISVGATVGRNYLVLVDDGFAVASRRNAALARLRDELDRFQPGDQMAVIEFDGRGLSVLSGWSADRTALAAALASAASHPARGNQLLAQQRSLDADQDLVKWYPDQDQRDQVREMLNERSSPEAVTQLNRSAAAAAAALRGFDLPVGRRVLLLLSAGWSLPVGPSFYAPLLDAANQLGYTLYPVDVATGEIEALRLFDGLARSTGGRAVTGGSAPVLAGIAEETGSYYWLGFTPSWNADNRRHAVEVRVRRADLEVRSRHSFSDLSRRAALTMKAESVLFFGGGGDASAGPGQPQLRVEAGAAPAGAGGDLELPVTLLLPVSALVVTPDGSGYVADVPLLVAALDKQGGRVELPGSILHFRFAKVPGAGGVARFRTSLKLRRIDQKIVFAVPDAQSGTVLIADLEVHPPT